MDGAGGELPEHGDWITTGEAARLWSRVFGHDVPSQRILRWCQHDDQRLDGVDRWHVGGRWVIERGSLLTKLRSDFEAGLVALDEIEKAPPPPK